MSFRLPVAVVVIASLAWSPSPSVADRPANPALQARIAEMAKEYLDQHRAVGIAIGILDAQGGEHHFAFGHTSKDGNESPNENTLFELGSITKCFTGILLADMIERGEVRLNDPAEKYLPRGAQLPLVGGRPITLEELVTYSSGLPRMPANFGRTEREHERYSEAQMLESLRELARRERGHAPQRHYLYSNLGFGLLGLCLAERAKTPPRTLIEQRVVRPLGMESTFFQPPPQVARRVAKTYDKDGRPMPPWETGAIAPAGMLRSTTKDTVRFIAANVGKENSPLEKAIQMTHRPIYETGVSEKTPHNHKIGMAWFIDPETGFIAHDGATGGSSSNVVFDPKTKTGVVVLINQEKGPVIALSARIMKLLHANLNTDNWQKSPSGDDGQ